MEGEQGKQPLYAQRGLHGTIGTGEAESAKQLDAGVRPSRNATSTIPTKASLSHSGIPCFSSSLRRRELCTPTVPPLSQYGKKPSAQRKHGQAASAVTIR